MSKLESWHNSLPSPRAVGGLFLLIIGAATFLRFYQIGNLSFRADELSTLEVTMRGFEDMRLWPGEMYMALYYVVVHYWAQIFPNASDGILRVPSAVFSAASIPVVFLLGRAMGANRTQAVAIGLIAALLVTVHAWHIQYAQDLRSYSLAFLLATLSTLLLIRAVEQPGSTIRWAGYTIVSAVAVYAHYLAILVLVAQAVSLVFLLRGSIRTFPFKGVAYSGIFIAVLIVPLAVAAFKVRTAQIAWIPELTLDSVKSFAIALTGNQGELLLSLYLLAASIGLGVGAWAWFREENLIRKWKFALVASCLFVPVAITLVFSAVAVPIFVDRYLLYGMTYLAVLAAVGIVALAGFNWERLKLTPILGLSVLLLVVGLSAVGTKAYFEEFQKEDFKGVAKFLSGEPKGLYIYYHPRAEVKVTYYNTSLESVDLWWKDRTRSRAQLVWRDELGENPTADQLAEFLPDGYSRAYLITWRLSPQRQEAKLIRSALLKKFSHVTTKNFYRLKVGVYEVGKPKD